MDMKNCDVCADVVLYDQYKATSNKKALKRQMVKLTGVIHWLKQSYVHFAAFVGLSLRQRFRLPAPEVSIGKAVPSKHREIHTW